ncbi:hypothetical protein BJ875DRAFT_34212 [Amylocarpus encephaloides]|uniref:Uncharacterized protein n=1 Tax=Amylocarpus encephaloides TaxID=45428 RepID=A0A9P7YIU7_9HELO|nr:hypothetical protein BJ875DRAFT_34212 [Amylocarpus encephaloides]
MDHLFVDSHILPRRHGWSWSWGGVTRETSRRHHHHPPIHPPCPTSTAALSPSPGFSSTLPFRPGERFQEDFIRVLHLLSGWQAVEGVLVSSSPMDRKATTRHPRSVGPSVALACSQPCIQGEMRDVGDLHPSSARRIWYPWGMVEAGDRRGSKIRQCSFWSWSKQQAMWEGQSENLQSPILVSSHGLEIRRVFSSSRRIISSKRKSFVYY